MFHYTSHMVLLHTIEMRMHSLVVGQLKLPMHRTPQKQLHVNNSKPLLLELDVRGGELNIWYFVCSFNVRSL